MWFLGAVERECRARLSSPRALFFLAGFSPASLLPRGIVTSSTFANPPLLLSICGLVVLKFLIVQAGRRAQFQIDTGAMNSGAQCYR
jgi:hypothetical protein